MKCSVIYRNGKDNGDGDGNARGNGIGNGNAKGNGN